MREETERQTGGNEGQKRDRRQTVEKGRLEEGEMERGGGGRA